MTDASCTAADARDQLQRHTEDCPRTGNLPQAGVRVHHLYLQVPAGGRGRQEDARAVDVVSLAAILEVEKSVTDQGHRSLESLPDIVHTKDGSAAVRELLVRGNAKVCLVPVVTSVVLLIMCAGPKADIAEPQETHRGNVQRPRGPAGPVHRVRLCRVSNQADDGMRRS